MVTIRRTRRVFSEDFKRRVVAEARQPDTSCSQVVRKYDLSTNLLHRWKRGFSERSRAAQLRPAYY